VYIRGYYLPRLYLLIGVLVLLTLLAVLRFTVFASSSSVPSSILTPVPKPTHPTKAPRGPVLRGFQAEAHGQVTGRLCLPKALAAKRPKAPACSAFYPNGAKVLFLTARPPNQGARFFATIDKTGHYSIRLRAGTYTVRVVGWRAPVTTVRILPTQSATIQTLQVVGPPKR
jgi:hypothetical protein